MRIETKSREWHEGKLKLADFAGKKERGDWGKQGYVRSLKEAQGAAAKRRTMPTTDPDPHEKTSGPRDPALPGTETREQMGKRLQSEAEALLPRITELVGLPSRWNRQAIEIGDASEKWRGKKNLSCSIAIREIEAVRPARWRTLIHELLHGHSPVYNQKVSYKTMTKNLILTREQVWAKMQSAFSLEEVRTTEKLITAYLKRTGDDSITSGGEILSHAKDYALTRQQQARELGLSPQETARRESLLRSFRGVEELEELRVIRQTCLDWQALLPNDPLLPDCFELLDSKERLANMLLNMESLPQAA